MINDEIGEQVFQAVHSCQLADNLVKEGHLDKAFESSKKAFLAAEKAFFDPSLLALLYFPEDQKYAIYIPLFLPVGIPVIMSLKTIYTFFKGSKVVEKSKTEWWQYWLRPLSSALFPKSTLVSKNRDGDFIYSLGIFRTSFAKKNTR